MKILHEEISGCNECPYMTDLAGGCLECGGQMKFDFYCSKLEGYRSIASEENRSLIKNEYRTGGFDNIIKFEIEIPTWCPLPNKE